MDGLVRAPMSSRTAGHDSQAVGKEQVILAGISDRLSNLREEFGNVAGRVNAAADRALGPDPEVPARAETDRPTAGMLSIIDGQLTELSAIAGYLRGQVSRIERVV